jgi:hypothetical protein
MTERLSVGGSPALAGLLTSLAATLPRSVRLIEEPGGPGAAVQLLDGRQPWARQALECMKNGAQWTIVVDPGEEEPDRVHALADIIEEGGPVLAFSDPFTDNPALPHFREQLSKAVNSCNMQAWTTGGLREAVLVQLRLARAFDIHDLAVRDVCLVPRSCLLTLPGKRHDTAFSLRTLITSSTAMSPRHILRFHGSEAMASLTLFGAETARPAEAMIVNAHGELRLPTIYETAHRSVLRGLAGRAGMTPAAVRDFAADIDLLRSLALS